MQIRVRRRGGAVTGPGAQIGGEGEQGRGGGRILVGEHA
jgi:hypothetical protein